MVSNDSNMIYLHMEGKPRVSFAELSMYITRLEWDNFYVMESLGMDTGGLVYAIASERAAAQGKKLGEGEQ